MLFLLISLIGKAQTSDSLIVSQMKTVGINFYPHNEVQLIMSGKDKFDLLFEDIRQAIRGLPIHPIIKVSPVNDELLSSIGKLTAEYGKIGSNLNQIARSLNEYGAPYRELSSDVRAAIGELHDLKYELLRKVGDAIGDVQAYQL